MIDPLQLVTAEVKNRHDTMGQDKQRVTILVKNLETLVPVSPFQMLIWVSQWSLCFKRRVAQHWGGRRHISGGKPVWSINLRIVSENSRKTVSVSTICDEYCSCKVPIEYVNENLFYRFEVSREEESVGNGFQKTRKWKNRGNIPHLWILINM